ncbi:MAG: M28 family peptidase [Gemmatimonadota bacterium]
MGLVGKGARLAGGAFVLMVASSGTLSAQMAATNSTAARDAAATITVADMQKHMGVIAHDSMRGRNTPSPELMKTARYVADRFKDFGLAPGNGDSYLQLYPISSIVPAGPSAHDLALTGPDGVTELGYGDEFFTLHDARLSEGGGPLAVVDIAGDFGNVDGRIVTVLLTAENIRPVLRGGLAEKLGPHDPAGVLVVLDIPQNFFDQLKNFLSDTQTRVGEVKDTSFPAAFVALSALPADLAAVVSEGTSAEGWSAHIRSEASVNVVEAPNTIGWLEGSDPELKNEYVVLTAHMDHVGVGRPVDGDSIYNGADDDASGTVTVIELAQAFASLPQAPRRSMVFMTVSGEEKGLLGSGWYADHPTFPLAQTVANLNMDMVGRNWTDTIVAIGKEESTLGPLVERVAAEHPELDMAVIDDLWPEEGFYSRSDHYNFARNGVPVLFFFNGTHDDYHRPSDHADKIAYDKMSRIGRLVFYTGYEIANADDRPAWDAAAYGRVVEKSSE